MKNFKFLIVLLITIAGFTSTNEVKAQSFDVSFSSFQQDLSPYGRWFNHPRFGQVWVYQQADFRPYYTDGHWEYTNYGWEWVSDYDWGWAPFHYGRWEQDPYYGWMWIPGYEWAPAWVSWSSYDNYYGWAPLGYGLNVNISFGSIPYDRWTFVPRQYICERNINSYYVAPQRNYGFRNATIINNVYNYNNNGNRGSHFFRGPDRNEVQRYTRSTVYERQVNYGERNRSNSNWGNRINNNNRNNSNDNRVTNGNDIQRNNNNNSNNQNGRNWNRNNNNATNQNNANVQNNANNQNNGNNQDNRSFWKKQVDRNNDDAARQQQAAQQRQQQQQAEQQRQQQQRQQQADQQRQQQQAEQQQRQQQQQADQQNKWNQQRQEQQQRQQQQQAEQQNKMNQQRQEQQQRQQQQPVYQKEKRDENNRGNGNSAQPWRRKGNG